MRVTETRVLTIECTWSEATTIYAALEYMKNQSTGPKAREAEQLWDLMANELHDVPIHAGMNSRNG